STAGSCKYNLTRLGGYNYINPLLFAEPESESDQLMGLKEGVSKYLEQYKSSGALGLASVYVRQLDSESGFSLNAEEKYDPGSLMKIPVLITVLRMSESDSHLLDKEVFFEKSFAVNRV